MTVATDDANNGGRVGGQQYVHFIENLHKVFNPTTYFEVGTLSGGTLKLASCASIAVDPQFRISGDVMGKKPFCMLFQEPSDTFFQRHNPTSLFGKEIDIAFLDGMHLFEFLLRDFINTEKFCRSNSIVILHDCLPPGFYMTVRSPSDPLRSNHSRFGDWWTGDVWKIIPVLKRYRPDLSVVVTDCAPTGLVMITNLDPKNDTLICKYNEIIKDYSRASINREEYDAYWSSIEITPSSELSSFSSLATKYWV